MQKLNILFIGKGGEKEGMGHLIRISTLVFELRLLFNISIIVKKDYFADFLLKSKGLNFSTYKNYRDLYNYLKYKDFQIIIIDIYKISIGVIRKIEGYCDFIVIFDDMKRLIQHSVRGVYICPQETYQSKIQRKGPCQIFFGGDYFPLGQEYQFCRSKKKWNPQINDVGIVLGGIPQKDQILKLTALMDSYLNPNVRLHVVLGYEPGKIKIGYLSKRVFFVKNIKNMAEFIGKLDLGIIASGFVKFEFMCIGTPFYLISRCYHQQKLAQKFGRLRYGQYLGDLKCLLRSENLLKKKIGSLINSSSERLDMFKKNRQLIDGKGGVRILKVLNNLK